MARTIQLGEFHNKKVMIEYKTVSEAISGLKRRGYTIDFNIGSHEIRLGAYSIALSPDTFEITEVHRFEGETNPDDEEVVYAIESRDGIKGVLVNGYGVSADPLTDELVKKLHIKH